jgi:seryl-tRNA synthetase
MLPLELIRKDPDRVRRAAELKGEEAPIDEILELDRRWRKHQSAAETTKAEQNQLSKEFAKSRDEQLKDRLREMAEHAKAELAEADAIKAKLDDLLMRVPNLFHESVPVGESEADNVVLREWGSKPDLGFVARTHYDLGEALGIMDFEHAARVSGSRFAFLLGEGALLERALVQFMLDIHTREHGYTEVQPPILVNSDSMTGTANLPKFGADAFRVEGHDLWLVPTAEVPLTNYHRDEILDVERLPLKYVAYSPCFRSEAGAAGNYADCVTAKASLGRDPIAGDLGSRAAEYQSPKYKGCFEVVVTVIYRYDTLVPFLGGAAPGFLRIASSTTMLGEY